MYCPACGIALNRPTRFCNRCGAPLAVPDTSAELERSEKRLDDYLDGLFWITVFGLGLILGGIVLMKKVDLSDFYILIYLILSSTAFLINFLLSLWGAFRISRSTRALKAGGRDTSQLEPPSEHPALTPARASSVTENTTRSFDPIYVKQKGDQ